MPSGTLRITLRRRPKRKAAADRAIQDRDRVAQLEECVESTCNTLHAANQSLLSANEALVSLNRALLKSRRAASRKLINNICEISELKQQVFKLQQQIDSGCVETC
jgi:nitric oxide synthase oxygenase domain/subunit